MNVIQGTNPGGNIGQAFGTGISSGLQNLLNNKLDEIQQQKSQMKTAQGLKSFFPNSKAEELHELAGLPPELLSVIVKQKAQELGNMDFANALGQGQQVNQPQQQQQISPLEQLLGSSEGFSPQQMELAQSQESALAQPQIQEQPKAISTLSKYEDILKNPKLKPEHRLKIEKLAQQERLAEKKEARELRKETREEEKIRRESFSESAKERAELLASGRQSRENLKEIADLEDLEKTGNLDTPGYVAFLERSGFDIPALMNSESEAFQKITTLGMFRGLKDATRGQITNREVEGFAKTIPSLLQSPEGRKRVLAGMKYINRINNEYTDGLKEIVNEAVKNKEPLPVDWREQLDTNVENKIDKLVKKFKEDLAKPVPKGQNKLVTALQAGAGSIVGAPGKLIGSVGGALSKLAA